MQNLRYLIDNEEKEKEIRKQSFNILEEDSLVVKPKRIEKNTKFLNFPSIYEDKKLLELAYKINDSFILSLKSDNKLTKTKIEDVLPEYISSFNETTFLNKEVLEEIKNFIIYNIFDYGAISFIMETTQEGLNDIIVNTKDYIDIIYKGKTYQTPFIFRSEEELRKIIDRMLSENNRKIDEAHPIVSSKLNDGSRVEVQIPPIAANSGSCVTIRKFNKIPLLIENLIENNQMDYKMAYFLIKAIKGKCNIIVSGGTSSGKTTFLNAISRFIDENEQLLVIEDTKELQPQMPCHSIRQYEARMANEEGKGAISLEYLLRSALRSSPRRIIVGECRGSEIVVMLNAMNTGHPGSMTTIHADDTKEALVRIENMYLEARPTANISFIRSQMVSAIDIIIQLIRFPDGSRKITTISEVEKRIEDNHIISLNNIFEFSRDTTDIKKTIGNFKVISSPSRVIEQMNLFGVDIDKSIFLPDFKIPKSMLIEELEKELPSKMCSWQNEFLSIFYERDPKLFHDWPHFQKMRNL